MGMSVVDRLFEEIEFRVANDESLPYFDEFVQQIKFLETSDQEKLKNEIYKMEWSIGTPRILSALQKNNLIKMSIFMLRQDPNKVHLILNDLLETEYVLLADLIQASIGNSSIAHQIKSLLEESISSLIQDLTENPNILKINYFTELKVILPDLYIQSFRDLHFNLLLKMESISLNECFKDKKLIEINRDEKTIFSSLVGEVISLKGFLVKLLSCTKDVDFTGWKFFFILLDQFLVERIDDGVVLRIKHLMKDLFHQAKHCRKHFYQMMLIGRYLGRNHSSILGSYSEWYRHTFSEMRDLVKTEEFKTIIDFLKGMVQLDEDTEIIQIHINISIPAPIHCNELVLNYKQLLRVRLFELNHTSSTSDNQSMCFDDEMEIY